MPTRSGMKYQLGEISNTMSSNTMSSNPEKPNTFLHPNHIAILKDIRGQVASLKLENG